MIVYTDSKTMVNAGSWDSIDYCDSKHLRDFIQAMETRINEHSQKCNIAYQSFLKEPLNTLRLEKFNEATIALRADYKYMTTWLDSYGRYNDEEWDALQKSELHEHLQHYGSCRDEGFHGKEYLKD